MVHSDLASADEGSAVEVATDREKPVFAFIALDSAKMPTEASLRKAVAKYMPSSFQPRTVEIDDKSVVLQSEMATFMAIMLNKPIPWRDLEQPCRSSLIWPEATKVMKKHKFHLIVTLMGNEDAFIDQNNLLTKFMAAATEVFAATGVYWGHGSVVTEPDFFRSRAKKASAAMPPNMLWIGFFPQKNRDNTINVVTKGMDYFGAMDVEVVRSRKQIRQILGMINGAVYLQLIGDEFEDGDTVGVEGTDQRVKTYHRKSILNRKGPVMRIDY